MSRLSFFWFLPSAGDGRYLVAEEGRRRLTRQYAQQIAQAAEHLGFDGMLLPTGGGCEDAWIAASSLIPVTEKLKFLIAVRPGLITAPVAAQMAATFDRFSNGRLLINVVAGGSSYLQKAEGLFLDHDARYELTDEFLTVWRELMEGHEVTFHGKHVHVEKARLPLQSSRRSYPPLYFGGSSEEGIRTAAKHADTYLTWGEPPHMAAQKIAEVKAAAEEKGRHLRFGIRLHVVVRETEDEAFRAAHNLLRDVDANLVKKFQRAFRASESVGQHRMSDLHCGRLDNLEVSPNLWAGIGLVRTGAGTALVGTPEIVAERIEEYRHIGFDTFILSGYPHLEEAYLFGESVLPLFRQDESQLSDSVFAAGG